MGLRFTTPLHTLFEINRNLPLLAMRDGVAYYFIFSELDFANYFLKRSNLISRMQTLHTVTEIVFIFDHLEQNGKPFIDHKFFIDPISLPGEDLRVMEREAFLSPFRDYNS